MRTLQQINDIILADDKILTTIFTRIFGQYMMRYYGDKTKKHTVIFDNYAESSYHNSSQNVICIAKKNIVQQLKSNVNPFAVAYHELAHVLYTNDKVRDKIREKTAHVLVNVMQNKNAESLSNHDPSRLQETMHSLWNVVEDERIERIMMTEYEFLRPILDPLKTIIQDDGLIMSWRLGKYANQVPDQKVAEQCELYLQYYNDKRLSQGSRVDYCSTVLATLWVLIFDQNQMLSQPTPPKTPPANPGKPAKGTGGGDVDDKPTKTRGGGDKPTQDKDDSKDDSKDDGKDDSKDDDKYLKALEKELENIEQNIQTQRIEKSYNDSVIDERKRIVVSKKVRDRYNNLFAIEIPLFASQKHIVRGGLTMGQAKSYKSDITSKLNKHRLVEAVVHNKEPKVFYNKGRDTTQLRKVVIFQDVSGSTHHTYDFLFDIIAYSLAKSFDQVDWWLYGDMLAKKHTQDFSTPSYLVGKEYNIASSTNSGLLVNVMQRYANEKAIFVVLTDGDLFALFQDISLFKKFAPQTAFVGELSSVPQDFQSELIYKSALTQEEVKVCTDIGHNIDSDIIRQAWSSFNVQNSDDMIYIKELLCKKQQYKNAISNSAFQKIVSRMINTAVALIKRSIK
jgi:hypothetical protein